MRYFLALFELPGEGQKVERILEKFAQKFSEDNIKEYDSDGAYLCSFLLLMLHTNVYNP
jgi:brefeldin A-inhibited guanine nucleotide-exchange protein